MKRTELANFIYENRLLRDVYNGPGVYAITVDDKIAYIGQSKNMIERCSQHIYHTENAIFNQEKKYLLLLSAKLGGHKIDCKTIAYGELDGLIQGESYFINKYCPPLNIKIPGRGYNDIEDLTIEELMDKLNRGNRYEI